MEKDKKQQINAEELENGTVQKVRKNKKTGGLILISVGILLLFLIVGVLLGYQGGINLRLKNYDSQVALAAAVQFQYGVIDLEEGRYDFARQRFEYVIGLDPEFPGAIDKLQEAMLQASLEIKPTVQALLPTVEPTQEIVATATPDTRGEAELLLAAEEAMIAENWDSAIEHLDQLRLNQPDYKTAKIDGMYYLAFRNLGVHKILYEGNLEGGMYDLSIAERFGTLDVEANSYRNYSRYYVTGASFWELDWAQVNYYFSLVYLALPNLVDGSGYTATERYRISSIHYADSLFEVREFCTAQVLYEDAYALKSDEEGLYEKLETTRLSCEQNGNASEQDN